MDRTITLTNHNYQIVERHHLNTLNFDWPRPAEADQDDETHFARTTVRIECGVRSMTIKRETWRAAVQDARWDATGIGRPSELDETFYHDMIAAQDHGYWIYGTVPTEPDNWHVIFPLIVSIIFGWYTTQVKAVVTAVESLRDIEFLDKYELPYHLLVLVMAFSLCALFTMIARDYIQRIRPATLVGDLAYYPGEWQALEDENPTILEALVTAPTVLTKMVRAHGWNAKLWVPCNRELFTFFEREIAGWVPSSNMRNTVVSKVYSSKYTRGLPTDRCDLYAELLHQRILLRQAHRGLIFGEATPAYSKVTWD
jgi:hypothetical protein